MRTGLSFGERPCRRFCALIPLTQPPAEGSATIAQRLGIICPYEAAFASGFFRNPGNFCRAT